MFKNILLVAAAALIVLGAAASLKNMKAVITSGNQAAAALSSDALELNDQVTRLREEQVRQATRLTIQQTTLHHLHFELERAKQLTATSGATLPPAFSIGLDFPSPEREKEIANYHAAWLQAIGREAELAQASTRYRELEQQTKAQFDNLEKTAKEQIESVRAEAALRYSKLNTGTQYEIARLKAEISQRDSSIVGLMHRLASPQTGRTSPQQPAKTQ